MHRTKRGIVIECSILCMYALIGDCVCCTLCVRNVLFWLGTAAKQLQFFMYVSRALYIYVRSNRNTHEPHQESIRQSANHMALNRHKFLIFCQCTYIQSPVSSTAQLFMLHSSAVHIRQLLGIAFSYIIIDIDWLNLLCIGCIPFFSSLGTANRVNNFWQIRLKLWFRVISTAGYIILLTDVINMTSPWLHSRSLHQNCKRQWSCSFLDLRPQVMNINQVTMVKYMPSCLFVMILFLSQLLLLYHLLPVRIGFVKYCVRASSQQ